MYDILNLYIKIRVVRWFKEGVDIMNRSRLANTVISKTSNTEQTNEISSSFEIGKEFNELALSILEQRQWEMINIKSVKKHKNVVKIVGENILIFEDEIFFQ